MTLEERVKRLETFIDRIANAFSLCASDGILTPQPLLPVKEPQQPILDALNQFNQTITQKHDSALEQYDYLAEANRGTLVEHLSNRISTCMTRRELDSVGEIIRVHHYRTELDDSQRNTLRERWVARQKEICPGRKF